jgi:cytochrome c oxidase subunit 4
MAHHDHHPDNAGSAHSGAHVHVSPVRNLVAVWGALVVLTVITVEVARFDLGSLNLWVAIGIAGIKASLVVLYFMHLRHDRPFNAVVFVFGILFVVLFIGFALMDTAAYQPNLIPDYAPAVNAQ